ncbi:phage tail assembly protein [Vibrio europaeus]|uniref:phage tail assembly protein n=1 Tax=Vibrio europaeus TaxID=300876 RepID=UPI00233EB0CE|nr:phage tail assembly protein [Vibrio europaeus]MDC5755221.1 phage tail assembly protein [Vibrio europaeus]MDC5775800.1 phage tail assembly protein [Vibrio europaeus]MDC5794938.1 phage tail assembly protein [Vibrio europaeus]MDC5799509.1 phage tail assembly protein [Vibrio europaeus]MDC5817217.1 phage tail assembly protein [Vibrio europaeus]
MATMSFDLEHGLPFGKGRDAEMQYDVELRELTAGDVIDARLAAERVSIIPDESGVPRPVAYHSDIIMGLELLRRQVKCIGVIQGPLSMKELQRLHLEDLQLLESKASDLDQAMSEAWGEETQARGRHDASGN